MPNDHTSNNEREKAPLHRPPSTIDAGKPNDGEETPIVKPTSSSRLVTPDPGSIPAGQTTKM